MIFFFHRKMDYIHPSFGKPLSIVSQSKKMFVDAIKAGAAYREAVKAYGSQKYGLKVLYRAGVDSSIVDKPISDKDLIDYEDSWDELSFGEFTTIQLERGPVFSTIEVVWTFCN